jgi:hypothetical protein
VIVAGIAIVVAGLIVVFTTWFDSNAKALAAIPNIAINPSATPLVQTDPNHIVLVSSAVANFKGQQVLGSNGQNLGSSYNIGDYALQSINHHLYYVAPLSYNNIFINLANSSTLGFVVVDPTLERDDNFHPYWTISLMQPTRGYTGDVLSDVLSKVLLVDAHNGNITEYNPQHVPGWVDRVMPSDTVNQYLTWWGLYHAAPQFNPSGADQQQPATDSQLVYNNADQPVWLVPMTSNTGSDNSSAGVFLFDTHKNQATFYTGAAGLGIGANVQNTFASTHANILRYTVDSFQLCQICSIPTWVAIYSSNGLLHPGRRPARHLHRQPDPVTQTAAGAAWRHRHHHVPEHKRLDQSDRRAAILRGHDHQPGRHCNADTHGIAFARHGYAHSLDGSIGECEAR